MTPEVDLALSFELETMGATIFPKIGDEYARKDLEIIAMSLTAIAEHYDGAAEIRYRENEDFRAVLAEASPMVSENVLRTTIDSALAETAQSLRISELNRVNRALRTALIALHARVEESNEDWAKRIDKGIWHTLLESTRRRAIAFWPSE